MDGAVRNVTGFGTIITKSEPAGSNYNGYHSEAGGISLNPIPSISVGASGTEILPESAANVIRYIVLPPSLNGMTESQIKNNIEFYKKFPNLKPYF